MRPPTSRLPPPRLVTAEVVRLAGIEPESPFEDLLERSLILLIALTGAVSYELFGHLRGAVTDDAAYFDAAMAVAADGVGLVLPLRPA